jgi:hypothetical protein
VEAKEDEYVPTAHCIHGEEVVDDAYVPGEHLIHEVEPSVNEFEPTGHAIHTSGDDAAATTEYVPAGHLMQLDLLLDAYEPAEHAVQEADPLAFEKYPSRHAVQFELIGEDEKVPGPH